MTSSNLGWLGASSLDVFSRSDIVGTLCVNAKLGEPLPARGGVGAEARRRVPAIAEKALSNSAVRVRERLDSELECPAHVFHGLQARSM
jgi:hypothetical protein